MHRFNTIPGVALPAAAVSLGTAQHGTGLPTDQAFAVLDTYATRGGNFIDTANNYGSWVPGAAGASERTVGAWLRSRGMRAETIVATKGGHPEMPDPPRSRLRPEDIAGDLAESLDRLAVERIDLYWLHRDDPAIPVDELIDALQVHRAAGRIAAIGASNWRPARIQAFNERAAARGVAGFCASQIAWNLRRVPAKPPRPHENTAMDDEAMAFHRASRLPVIPYAAQAGGFFAKPLPHGVPAADAARWHRVAGLASRRGASPNSVALAYILDHPCGGFGIVGCRTPAQVHDSMDAAALRLSPDEVDALAAD